MALAQMLVIVIVAGFSQSVRAGDEAPYSGAITAISNAYVAAITAQADTNASTVATGYTPRRVGDVLVGGAGTGTNAVWISKGSTSNDWVKVQP